jgi:Restriction endonuclease
MNEQQIRGVRPIDMLLLDEVLEMGGGYVLNFTDRTMSQFFATELNIDIDEPKYSQNGSSKAKRLRSFLTMVDAATAARTLRGLWEYRQALFARGGSDEVVHNAEGRMLELLNRLDGRPSSQDVSPPAAAFNRQLLAKLRSDLIELWQLQPQARGYAFETFLKRLFDAFHLKAREAFKIKGEQIDGSFDLHSQTYLLEAKWQANPIGAADLHVFEGKLSQKAAWSRGLFISYTGFTEDGLHAFGKGKRLVCMDGQDLDEALMRELPIDQVLDRKVRRAAETGATFVRVRDLF